MDRNELSLSEPPVPARQGVASLVYTPGQWRLSSLGAAIGRWVEAFSGILMAFLAYEAVGRSVFGQGFRDPVTGRIVQLLESTKYPYGFSGQIWLMLFFCATAIAYVLFLVMVPISKGGSERAQALEAVGGLPACAAVPTKAAEVVRRLRLAIANANPAGQRSSPFLGVAVYGGGRTFVVVESEGRAAVVETGGPVSSQDACVVGVLPRVWRLRGLNAIFPLMYISDVASSAKGATVHYSAGEALFALACWCAWRLWAARRRKAPGKLTAVLEQLTSRGL